MGCEFALNADVVIAVLDIAFTHDLQVFAGFHQNAGCECRELIGNALRDTFGRVGDKNCFVRLLDLFFGCY